MNVSQLYLTTHFNEIHSTSMNDFLKQTKLLSFFLSIFKHFRFLAS